ncbi:hypothetical protein F4780DRAFT_744461 [Xylariomycetidae sp. FL0641]|nr:hypothetical protein F4780DRAFT_744461 [Xylariomycetidae sp. FL0641]
MDREWTMKPSVKRKRTAADETSRTATAKRTRHTTSPDLLSPLSDELLVRILSLLPLSDLLNVAPVSNRFYHLSGDSQIWKRLYYARFVLPRALRIPGFRDGSAREGKLHYSARRAIWADGRHGGWVDKCCDDGEGRRNWKRQYKLRHNWSRGSCAVEELQVGGSEPAPSLAAKDTHKMLVKVSEGIAVTADAATGLRAWHLKTKQILAQTSLDEPNSEAAPTCVTIDDQHMNDKRLDVAIGFSDGSFGVWGLNIAQKKITKRYRHEKSSNGSLEAVAYSYPYLLTATRSFLISLYTFPGPPAAEATTPNLAVDYDSSEELDSEELGSEELGSEELGSEELASEELGSEELGSEDERAQMSKFQIDSTFTNKGTVRSEESKPNDTLQAPYLITSLKSPSSRAPISLSLRKSAVGLVASIAYTFSAIQGWSFGIQELHLRPSASRSNPNAVPDIIRSRLAYTIPVTTFDITSLPYADGDGPVSLSYTHPYLLAVLSDNTLAFHLCSSTASSLRISPGIRLMGHSSGISDAEVTAHGKAVSVSTRGDHVHIWDLEPSKQVTGGWAIDVRPNSKPALGIDIDDEDTWDEEPEPWGGRRNWVGFDDEMVIVLKESKEGKESLMVYDFT